MRSLLPALAASLLLLADPVSPAQEPHPHPHSHEDDPTHGGLLEGPEPEMAPEEVGALVPTVRTKEGDAGGLRVEVEREPHDGFPGIRARVRVTNEGATSRTIDAIAVAEETPARPWFPPAGCRVLTIEGERLDRCEVVPCRIRREGRRVAVVALPDRRLAFVAGFPDPPPGVETHVAVSPGLAVTLKLDAEVRYPDGRRLAPGESLATPELLVLFAPEAWVGLEAFLSDAPPPVAGADALSSPIVPFPRDDGAVGLARNPRGRALDLMAADGRGHVWRLDREDGPPEVRLDNPDADVRVVRLRFADVGVRPGEAVELIGPDRSHGLHRIGATLLVPPSSSRTFRIEARPERTPGGSAGELVAVAPPEIGRPVTIERFTGDDPELGERLARAYKYGGFVIANHRGAGVLEPVPPALAASYAPTVFPAHATATRAPREEEAAFLERAANVEWSLGLPRRGPDAATWLVCREAGFDAMPIEGLLADGAPAGRGFLVPTSPGLTILALDLAEDEVDALVDTVRSAEVRRDVLRQIGRAMRVLRAGSPGGLFDALPFERHAPIDLAPASGFSTAQWAVQVAADGKAVERRPTVGGGAATEDVLLFSRPMVFALDVPTGEQDRLAVVVRRRASATLDDWALELDATPIGDVRRRTRPSPTGWIDEIVTFGAAEIRRRPRVALVVHPIGGVLPLARMAFLRVPPLPGQPLRSLDPARLRIEGPGRFDLDADGYVLRMGDEAFLDGVGLRPGGALEVDLEGASLSLLARVGVDADAPPDARATLRVVVDGTEQQATEILAAGDAPIPLTVPL
ncbi:MAG: NPCBM/NEW2 domain-containing protein, partial [Planctomycetota bacterium JB042]